MRSGPELVRATAPYAREDRGTTWRLLAITGLVYVCSVTTAIGAPWLGVRLLAAVLAGLVLVRLFIFYHDHLHGAILQKSALGEAIMRLVGYWMLSGPSVWRQTHDYHHKHTAKMVGASIGSYPVVTVEMWRQLTPAERRGYRLMRHPLNMIFGYFTVFVLGMCISPFRRNPAQHKDGPVALLVHFGGMAAVGLAFGWDAALLGVFLPQFLASALGSYLFYAQHNFPGMQLRDRQEWEFSFAATRSSSMFRMSPLLHWFTGNIGYHHVHHLNHRIPFYRLAEAMKEMPELQDPGVTSWRPADILACLRLALWDTAQARMVTWDEADAAMDEALPAK